MPEVELKAPLAKLLLAAVKRATRCGAGDVLVIAQKIVSRQGASAGWPGDAVAEGAELAKVADKDPRLIELILRESRAVLRVKPGVIIVEHRLGFVMASAGVDQSKCRTRGRSACRRRTRMRRRAGYANTACIGATVGVVIMTASGEHGATA
jgi:coenzyme F420-0:L-glutamate ligase/coenzyme F420-1:gamma-L-glutamate ligase